MKGFVGDIEEITLHNSDFRRVLYTGKKLQLVLMSLAPGEDIGEEVHRNVDQFFRIEKGQAELTIDGLARPVQGNFAFVVPAGARHNVRNTGAEPLKLYTVYGPPQHADGTVHATRADALELEEHFVGLTTE